MTRNAGRGRFGVHPGPGAAGVRGRSPDRGMTLRGASARTERTA